MRFSSVLIVGLLSLAKPGLSEEEPEAFISETIDHIKRGALIGKNMSLSKEDLTLSIIKSMYEKPARFCLSVAGKEISESFMQTLAELGHIANDCEGERIVEVKVGNFSEPIKGSFSASYSYYCGSLCAAQYDCLLEINRSGQLEFKGCDLKWIS